MLTKEEQNALAELESIIPGAICYQMRGTDLSKPGVVGLWRCQREQGIVSSN